MNEIIKQCVDRFLMRKLPEHFRPDGGVSFARDVNGAPRDYQSAWWPVGTNLFDAEQAKEMFEHCLAGSGLANVTFSTLREANITRDIEWGAGQKFSLSYRGNELAGEVGEACNILKKLDRERMGLVGSRADLEKLADELADVVICVDLAAMDVGIDLAAAVARKFNMTSDKNGLKTKLPEAVQ